MSAAVSVAPGLHDRQRKLGLSPRISKQVLFPVTSDSLESEASIRMMQEVVASKSNVGRDGGLALGYCEEFDNKYMYKSKCRFLV